MIECSMGLWDANYRRKIIYKLMEEENGEKREVRMEASYHEVREIGT
jgi:hypothetical protein